MTNIATEIGDWLKSYDITLARNPQSKDYTTTFIYSKLQNVPHLQLSFGFLV